MSTFHGLEMAKQALFAQRSALNTTAHNISNVNTKGYSRQRVNFEAASAYPVPGLNRPGMSGQMGTGVETGVIERIRNKFLDLQYRSENSKSGFWESKSDALHRLEQLMNEPSESGISHTMNQFWESLEELSANPDNEGAKSVVAQRAETFASALNYTTDSISSQRSNLKETIGNADDKTSLTYKVNDLVDTINELNEQIKGVEVHGNLPNDLYDQRDNYIDELSKIVNVKVTYTESGEHSLDSADGLTTLELVDRHGNALNNRMMLLNGENGDTQKLDITYDDDKDAVSGVILGQGDQKQSFSIDEFSEVVGKNGSLMGHIDSYGYVSDGEVKGTHPKLLQDLHNMTGVFVEEFNTVYRTSDSENDDFSFFVLDEDTHEVHVNESIIDHPENIDANGEGYGDLAGALADVFEESLEDLGGATVNKYFESVIGGLGAEAQDANRMNDNVEALRTQVASKRSSVSEVSLDEEMTNMIKFQHAYNAAARSMTVTDELLDRIINNMGLVGR